MDYHKANILLPSQYPSPFSLPEKVVTNKVVFVTTSLSSEVSKSKQALHI